MVALFYDENCEIRTGSTRPIGCTQLSDSTAVFYAYDRSSRQALRRFHFDNVRCEEGSPSQSSAMSFTRCTATEEGRSEQLTEDYRKPNSTVETPNAPQRMLHLPLLAALSSASAPASGAAAAGSIAVVQSSEAGDKWREMPPLAWATEPRDEPAAASAVPAAEVTVGLGETKQEVMGFGAAMTDTSAYNAMVWMDDAVRSEYFEALWGKTGLGLSIGRVTLNSADYSFQSFNYDNVTDDFALAHFDHSLAYDRQRVMPMIRRAMSTAAKAWGGSTAESIKLFASPWSPPGWMKTNDNMINSNAVCLKNDTAAGSYKQTWANYIAAWLDGYKEAGLPMWGLTPQNEPEARQHKFESCAYTPELMVDFVGKYLGPAVTKSHPALKIMGFDHNKLHSLTWMKALYGDAASNGFLSGTAVHWYDYMAGPIPGGGGGGGLALENLDAIHALAPAKFMLNTEACTLGSLAQDWKTAALYMVDIIGDLNHWVNGWCYWNQALLEGTKVGACSD
jgi:glucosylceramidase